jgi:hypothetical protein
MHTILYTNTQRLGSRCLLPWRLTNGWRSLFKFFSVRQILPPCIKLSTSYGQRHAEKIRDWTGITVSLAAQSITDTFLCGRSSAVVMQCPPEWGGTASALLHNSTCDHTNWRRTGIATALQVPASDNLVPYVSHINEMRLTKPLTNCRVLPNASSSPRPYPHWV